MIFVNYFRLLNLYARACTDMFLSSLLNITIFHLFIELSYILHLV